MKMVRLISIVYVVLLSWSQTPKATGISLINENEAVSLGLQIYEGAGKFRGLMKSEMCNNNGPSKGEVSVFTGLGRIDNQIAELHDQLSSTIADVSLEEFHEKMRRIQNIVDYVNSTYNNFFDLMKSKDCVEEFNLNKSIVASVWDYTITNLQTLIVEMHKNFIEPSDAKGDNLLTLIYNDKIRQLKYNRLQSIQQTLTQIYNSIVITELKALALQLISLDLLEEKTSNTEELKLEHFKSRISKLYNAAINYIVPASRKLWKYDPDNFIEGKSYSKLQQIFQAVILNEGDTTQNTCSYSGCHQISKMGHKVTYRPNSPLAKQQTSKLRCEGYITDCWDTSEYLHYCAAPENDDRRYAGIKYSGKTYGEPFDKNSCLPRYGRVDTHTYNSDHCDSCLCTCASIKVEVDRYFSLKPVTSNTQKRMVITGVHLRLINHVFYIDIREGQLGKNGNIEPGSTKWRNTSSEEKIDFEKIMADDSSEFEVLPPNDEVYVVHWEQKTVFLDDIEDESGNLVLTGLRFAQQKDALKLEIRLSPFEYETGNIGTEHVWRGNEQTVASRQRVTIQNADNPVKRIQGKGPKNNFMSPTGTFLEFTTTSREKDLGQFTIPFIDTQEVVTEPPTPLFGAGLYHKGLAMGESGGFLGLKLIQQKQNLG